MVHRALDVVFQHLIKLIVGLILVTVLMGGVGYAIDRTPTVGMRLWAQRPVYTPSFSTNHFASYQWPSAIECSLLRELLATDTFINHLLVTIDPQSAYWRQELRDSVISDLRQNIAATPEGEHLYLVTYRTAQIDYGRRVLGRLIVAFGAEIQAIDTETVTAAESALRGQFNSAKQAMDDAIKQAETYRTQHSRPEADPNYQSLVTQAHTLTDRYLSLQAQLGQVQQSKSAVATSESSLFRIADPPSVMPQRLITKQSLMLRLGIGSFGATLALEALLIYVIARRDPSIRSVEDVRRQIDLRPLGSAPRVGSR
jgi:hypothetical protein